jgi:hypothetical protein
MHDVIKALCRKLLEASDDEEAASLAQELQRMIHQHLEMLHLRVLANMGRPAPSPEEVVACSKTVDPAA